MSNLKLSDLAKEYQEFIHLQDYSKQPTIEGVRLVELKNMVGEDGDFSELLRLNEKGEAEAFPEFKIVQINRSNMLPHSIKAWHLHLKQDEIQSVLPSDRLLVGMWDLREDSPTKNMTMRVVLGNGKAQLLYIPKGVAHGYANHSKKPTTILYFVNQQFTLEDPDELRVAWDSLGADFWEPIRE
jgi:dTDP-4-dehydrorhamnose 3,5-epimerase